MDRTLDGGGKADLDDRCHVGEISQRRKPPRWRVMAEPISLCERISGHLGLAESEEDARGRRGKL